MSLIDTRRRLALVSLLFATVLASFAAPAEAAVNAFWRELGGSASGGGVSQSPPGRGLFGQDVAPGRDGRPIVVYAEEVAGPTTEGDARIVVKRWTGSAWQLLSPAGGVGSRGALPQIEVAPNGTIYVAWMGVNDLQVHLRRRTAAGTVWEQLSGSDDAGGLTRLNGSSVQSFSLAVAPDSSPIVAFTAPSQVGVSQGGEGIFLGSQQIYALRHMGAAGWQYLGSSPLSDGAGASNIPSFLVDAGRSYTRHEALNDFHLAVDSAGRPLVAFQYGTQYLNGSVPPGGSESGHRDLYVTRFEANSSTWTAVGPAVPQGDDGGPARGGPGGLTTSPNTVQDFGFAADPTGDRLYVVWWDAGLGADRIYLRRWNGVDAWEALNGSASGNGLGGALLSRQPSVAVDGNGNAIVTWFADRGSRSQIYVRRSNAFDQFEEMGPDSASSDGISGNADGGMGVNPRVVHFNGVSATPADNTVVLWENFQTTGPVQRQVFLRQFTEGTSFQLSVGLLIFAGRVRSTPIGIDCPDDACNELFPAGQVVSLTPIAGPDFIFDRWGGACTGSGACNVAMTANRSVSARFVDAATLAVDKEGLGTITGPGIACGLDCVEKYPLGTTVTLVASAPAGTFFDRWGGDCAFRGRNTSCTLAMSANRTVSADFDQRVYRLDVAVTNPAGTVVNGVGGSLDGVVLDADGNTSSVSCEYGAGVCSRMVAHGDRVTLSTVPVAGNKFLNYTGTVCGGRTNSTCEFTATGNTSITALLRGVTAILVSKLGNGASRAVLEGPGIVCGNDCVGEAFTGTQVVITQTPGTGNRLVEFDGPSGCREQLTCSFLAEATARIDATYQLDRHRLFVTGAPGTTPGYSLSNPLGIDCGNFGGHGDCEEIYDYGTVVALRPLPGTDSRFISWTGCSRLNGTTCLVDMTANRAVKQTFGAARTLSLAGSGNGRGRYLVPGQPPGVCLGNCSYAYLLPFNQNAVVTPVPDTGSNYIWNTACPGGRGTCPFLMSQNRSGSGRFQLNRHRIVVTNRLNGSVFTTTPLPDSPQILCGSGDNLCTSEQDFGTTVLLRAVPDEGNTFVNWTGSSPCSVGARATNQSCVFALQGNVSAIPNFRARTAVSLVKQGDGAGTITGPGFNCGPDCSETVLDSKRVILVAKADIGSRFSGFAGSCMSNASACSFVPTGDNQTVFATFNLLPFTVTLTSRNQGVVTTINGLPDPIVCGDGGVDCLATLLFGTPVVLHADPNDGFAFVSWAGDPLCAGKTNATCPFTVPARNVSVTPGYRPRTFVNVFKPGNGDGLVTGPGFTCGTDCVEPIVDGKAITLTAKAAVGSGFLGFGNACVSNTSACTFTPAGEDRSVSATFALLPFTLTVASRNQGVVTSLPMPDRLYCGSGFFDCSETDLFGTTFVFRADPNDGFLFDRWGTPGPCAGSTNRTCTHRLLASTTATPIYRARTLVTVVKPGDGTGTVTGAGFNCGTDCSENVFDGKTVTLTAASAVGSRFLGFGGACVSNTSTCAFTPAGNNQTVSATFVLQQFVLSVTNRANGSVTGTTPAGTVIFCGDAGGDCSETMDFGTPVTVVAAPNAGFVFANWTGDAVCTGRTNRTCSFLTPTRNVSLTPNYRRATLVRIFNEGQGRVTGTGINCSAIPGVTGTDCSETIFDGASLTLTAIPGPGRFFSRWADDPSCAGVNTSVCTFTPVGAETSVTAFYPRLSVVATIVVSGNGSVVSGFDSCDTASSPCPIPRLFGDQIILSATPDAGQQFVSWAGCTSTNGSVCTLLLNGNRTATVTFREGIRLSGGLNALAIDSTFDLPPVGVDTSQIKTGIIMTRLDVRLASNATVGQVNAALAQVGGGIVSMARGFLAVTIAVPRQPSVEALQALARTLGSAPGIAFAFLAVTSAVDVLPSSNAATLDHHLLPTRFPAAWNARSLVIDPTTGNCRRPRVRVLVGDKFARPAPYVVDIGNSFIFFSDEVPNFSLLPPGESADETHGYDVTLTLGALFNPEARTGANPFSQCLDITGVVMNALSGFQNTDRLVQNFPAGKFILNVSMGFGNVCVDAAVPPALGAVPVPCEPRHFGTVIATAIERAGQTLHWKERTLDRWPDFLVATSAGNSRNKEAAVIYPALGTAAQNSPRNAATLSDPFLGFARDLALWRPTIGGFASLAATSAEAFRLTNEIVALGLDQVGGADNVLKVGSTTRGSTLADLVESELSNSGPDVSAVGEEVLDHNLDPVSGTSFSAPQVAGLASYLWLLSEDLVNQPAQVTRRAIIENARTVPLAGRVIDAYAAVLSLDAAALPNPANAPIRLAILDVNTGGASAGRFDEADIGEFLSQLFVLDAAGNVVEPPAADFSRYDLNGDGFTGGSRTERFDLDRACSTQAGGGSVCSTQFGATGYGMVTQAAAGNLLEFDENALTDLDILCYYAYSPLYTGNFDVRRALLSQLPGQCGAAPTGAIRLMARLSNAQAQTQANSSACFPFSSFENLETRDFLPFGGTATAATLTCVTPPSGATGTEITQVTSASASQTSTVNLDPGTGVLSAVASGSATASETLTCVPPSPFSFCRPRDGAVGNSNFQLTFDIVGTPQAYVLSGSGTVQVFRDRVTIGGEIVTLANGSPQSGVLGPGTYLLVGGAQGHGAGAITQSFDLNFTLGPSPPLTATESRSEIVVSGGAMMETLVDDVRRPTAPLFMLFDLNELDQAIQRDIVERVVTGQST